jgi:hypothetical protein
VRISCLDLRRCIGKQQLRYSLWGNPRLFFDAICSVGQPIQAAAQAPVRRQGSMES